MSLFVKFWGTRGSIPTPGPATARYGGNTACVEIRTDEALFVCDGGTGLRELGQELTQRAQGRPIPTRPAGIVSPSRAGRSTSGAASLPIRRV